MLVKLNQAHRYRGVLGQGPHAAMPGRKYAPGAVIELPARYYERALEPYGFADVVTDVAKAKKAPPAPAKPADKGGESETVEAGKQLPPIPEDLAACTVAQLRQLAAEHGVLEEIKGTGAHGRVVKEDLIDALMQVKAESEAEE